MSLLDRVSTLLRANLNDLVEKAEDPERMLKQIVLDMENQLLQVKTQVAIAIADQHLLEKKRAEHEEQAADWRRKAELAVHEKPGRPGARCTGAGVEPRPACDRVRRAGRGPEARSRQSAPGSAQAGAEAKRDARALRDAGCRTSPRQGGGPRDQGTAGRGQRTRSRRSAG